MRKKVLVAEEVDTVRAVAETVLRQNGFEVISVASAERAREVLQLARPDVIVMGATISTRDSRPLYEKVQADPRTSSVPILIIAGEDNRPVPFPREAIAARPLEPVELLQKVQMLVGEKQEESGISFQSVGDGVGDDFLDSALGLDDIHVTDSEVLDRTKQILREPSRGPADQMMPVHHEPDNTDMGESSRVESLMIRSDAHGTPGAKPAKRVTDPEGAGKLELMADQYGLSNPDALKSQARDDKHDYNWFVQSMRDENDPRKPKPVAPPAPTESGKTAFTFEDPLDSTLDAAFGTGTAEDEVRSMSGTKSTVGVEKFIDEFKREMERLRSTESEELLDKDDPNDRSEQKLHWEESLEKVDRQQMELFTRQLAAELAEKLAGKIVAKIDSEKLLQFIKQEIVARARKPH